MLQKTKNKIIKTLMLTEGISGEEIDELKEKLKEPKAPKVMGQRYEQSIWALMDKCELYGLDREKAQKEFGLVLEQICQDNYINGYYRGKSGKALPKEHQERKKQTNQYTI